MKKYVIVQAWVKETEDGSEMDADVFPGLYSSVEKAHAKIIADLTGMAFGAVPGKAAAEVVNECLVYDSPTFVHAVMPSGNEFVYRVKVWY